MFLTEKPEGEIVFDAQGKPLERNLYVPFRLVDDEFAEGGQKWITTVSMKEQMNSANKLIALGYAVYVHKHAFMESCVGEDSPNGGCLVKGLRAGDEWRNVVEVSETDSEKSL